MNRISIGWACDVSIYAEDHSICLTDGYDQPTISSAEEARKLIELLASLIESGVLVDIEGTGSAS